MENVPQKNVSEFRALKTAKAALCLALLQGRVLNLKNCFKDIGYSNPAREIPRMVEEPFGVKVDRIPMVGKSRYKTTCTWVNYRLVGNEENKDGIEKMWEYVESMLVNPGDRVRPEVVSEAEVPEVIQSDLFNGA